MAQIKAALCSACGSSVSMLGSYVRCSSTEYRHLGCYTGPVKLQSYEQGRADLIREQRDTAERRAALEASVRKDLDDAAKVQAEALRTVNAENARRIEATKKATDALRLEQQGQATPRFQAIAEELEILPPEPAKTTTAPPQTTTTARAVFTPPPFNPRPIEMD